MRSAKESVYILQNEKAEGLREALTLKGRAKEERGSKSYEQSQGQSDISGIKEEPLKEGISQAYRPREGGTMIKEPVSSIILQFHDQLTNVFSKITTLILFNEKKIKMVEPTLN